MRGEGGGEGGERRIGHRRGSFKTARGEEGEGESMVRMRVGTNQRSQVGGGVAIS